MKTKYILSALLAAGLATAAHAQAVGDLIVGFQQTGNTSDYEIDLGSLGGFQGLATDSLVNLSANVTAADLQALFGSSALTGGTVTWGAAATNGGTTLAGITGAAKTTWVSQNGGVSLGLAPSIPAPNSAYKDTSGTTLNARETAIGDLETGATAGNGFVQSSDVTNGHLSGTLATTAPSWTGEVNGTIAATGTGFPGTPTIDGGTNLSLSSGQYSVVDLFTYISGTTSTSGTYFGSLELSSTGGLSFTNYVPTAIPEPSTYAAILGAACLAFVAIRRRKQQVLA
jgi:hypothetical protein